MRQTGDVYPFSAELATTVLPEGWRPIGAVTIAMPLIGGTTPAVVACHVVGGVDPADAADAAAAQSAAERAARGSSTTTLDGPPASAFLLAKQLYASAGRTPPPDLAADAAAVWARVQAGADMGSLRTAAAKGGKVAPPDAALDVILVAGGDPPAQER